MVQGLIIRISTLNPQLRIGRFKGTFPSNPHQDPRLLSLSFFQIPLPLSHIPFVFPSHPPFGFRSKSTPVQIKLSSVHIQLVSFRSLGPISFRSVTSVSEIKP